MAIARVLTDSEIQSVRKLAPLLNQEQLSDYLGMSPDTFKRICDRDEKVMRAYKESRSAVLGKIAGSLVKEALEGSLAAKIFYLKTQGRWSESKEDTNINLQADVMLTHNIVGIDVESK